MAKARQAPQCWKAEASPSGGATVLRILMEPTQAREHCGAIAWCSYQGH